ncbi:MAG: undecaprenyl-diphosphate phosphatase [Thermomicrobiales bacterium]
MSYVQAIILGLLQGVTELFPISSLGHSVILPKLLGWDLDQKNPFFLNFLIATHLATATVLLGFFWKDWVQIVGGILRSLKMREVRADDVYARLGWLLILGTIPAGILGLLLEHRIRSLFASAQIAAGFLILNGVMLYGAEMLRRRARLSNEEEPDSDTRIAQELSWPKSFGVGAMQAIALIPGFSRTGATISGGLLVGLSHEDSARFSFLLATPIIAAAALLKLPELAKESERPQLGHVALGSLCSAFTAYLAIRFLTRYFQTKTLTPFAAYCLGAGAFASVLLLFR